MTRGTREGMGAGRQARVPWIRPTQLVHEDDQVPYLPFMRLALTAEHNGQVFETLEWTPDRSTSWTFDSPCAGGLKAVPLGISQITLTGRLIDGEEIFRTAGTLDILCPECADGGIAPIDASYPPPSSDFDAGNRYLGPSDDGCSCGLARRTRPPTYASFGGAIAALVTLRRTRRTRRSR